MPSPPDPFANLSLPHLRWSMTDPVPPWLRLLHKLLDAPRHDAGRPWTDGQLEAVLQKTDKAHADTGGFSRVRSLRQRSADDSFADQRLTAVPSTLMRLALGAMSWRRGHGGALPVDAHDFSGMGAETGADALQLLAEASEHAMRDGEPWQLPGLQSRGTLRLHVLVLASSAAGSTGDAVHLDLQLIRRPKAGAALLPAPKQLLTPVTELWADSFRRAQSWWVQVLQPDDVHRKLRDLAVVWRVLPQRPSAPVVQLQGDSASAALALGGLWLLAHAGGLLRDLRPSNLWAEPLRDLRWSDFNTLFLTACILDGHDAEGTLDKVGGAVDKAAALQLARKLVPPGGRLVLRTAGLGAAEAQALGVAVHPNLLHLARELCSLGEPDSDDQKRLTMALCTALQAGIEAGGDQAAVQLPEQPAPNHAPPTLALNDHALRDSLRRLSPTDSSAQPEVRTLAHLALHRWAAHGRSLGGDPIGGEGQVHHRFVNLQVERSGAIRQTFTSLEQLLADPDVSRLEAVLVEGEPGAGKSWLLMRHEQALCEQIIAAHGHLVPGPTGTRPAQQPVLPLYLPLRDLPADADPVDWTRTQLEQRFPNLRPGLGVLFNDGWRPWRLRLMLDGLNEVQVRAVDGADPAAERSKRVTYVVLALKRALRPDLTMLLGSRPNHPWSFRDDKEELRCARASVQRWNRAQIQRYVEQRWASLPDRQAKFMALLPEDPLADNVTAHGKDLLLGLPLFLNMQCELWEAGASHLMHKRSQLLASMLWPRVLAAHDRDRGKPEHIATPGMGCEHSELPAARAFLVALDGQPDLAVPPSFPNRGLLLQGLLALAKRQWLHHAHGGQPAEVRGQVAVGLDLVRQVLQPLIKKRLLPGLRGAARLAEIENQVRRWLLAAQDLGIAQWRGPGLAGHAAGSFAFSHQVLGEWLASQALFYTGAAVHRLQPHDEPQPRH